MPSLNLWQNKIVKISQLLLVFIVVFTWIFSGWPRIWQNPPFPPNTQTTFAVTIPSGVIVAWPSTVGSIPSGWTRVTSIDATYVRGVPNTSTDPGTTGGATTHTHTTSAHDHTISHTHATATSGNATGSVTAGTTSTADLISTTHTHTTGTVSATLNNSGTSSPSSSGTTSNDPAYLKVIWIQSNGTPTGIPAGALAMFNSASLPPNWAIYANSQDRFLKGADASGDGGATSGAATHNHTGEGSHTHTSDHVHPNGTSGISASTNNSYAAGTVASGDDHTHTYTVSSNNFGTSNSATLNTSTDNHEPPWQKLAIIENQTGGVDTPIGTIAVWRGTLANIPAGWIIADGNNGTPNLLSDFVKGVANTGEIGNTGGSTSHTHTGSNHTHTWASTVHTHTVNFISPPSVIRGTAGSTATWANPTHTHTATSGAASAITPGNAAPNLANATHLPPYEEVAYIMFQGIVDTPAYDNGTATYNNDVSVTITVASPASSVICYTTNGDTPAASTPGTCSTGTTYSGPVSITATGIVLKAIGTKSGYTNSSVQSATYTLQVANPSFGTNGGSFNNDTSTTFSSTTTGTVVFCSTLDGSTPAAASPPTCSAGATGASATVIATGTAVKVLGTKANYVNSAVQTSNAFTLTVGAITSSPGPDTYVSTQNVTLSIATTTGATAYYTINGDAVTCSSTTYSGAIEVVTTTTVKAIGCKTNYVSSNAISDLYTIDTGPSTAIEVVGKVADTAITTITFPQGAPGSTVSTPYNDIDTVADAQVLHASASEPVVRLKNTSAGALNITLEITTWTNGIVASEGYALSDTGTTTTSAVTDNNLSTDGNANSVATAVSIGAGAYKALYLELILSNVAAKTGTSTLTILGET